jgi:hypothetical protein
MTEAEGCAVLREEFSAAGFAIVERFIFDEGGVKVDLDGWDASKRVGYEYITDEAHDRDEFTPRNVAALEARMRAGELWLLLIDEHDAEAEAELRQVARAFLDHLKERGVSA